MMLYCQVDFVTVGALACKYVNTATVLLVLFLYTTPDVLSSVFLIELKNVWTIFAHIVLNSMTVVCRYTVQYF